MRAGTIATLLGISALQWEGSLPDAMFGQFLPVCLAVALFHPVLRLPALFGAGFLWAVLRGHLLLGAALPEALEGRILHVVGVVAGVPSQHGSRVRFVLDIERIEDVEGIERGAPLPRFGGPVRLSWYEAGTRPAAGERWRLAVKLKRPRRFANPHGFDYARWLHGQGLRATGYVRARTPPRRMAAARALDLHALRERIARAAQGGASHAPTGALLAALTVGVRDGLSEHQWTVLRRTGTAHLIAISGLHVGLVAGLAFVLASAGWRWAGAGVERWPAQRVGAWSALAAAIGYAALAGFSVPTQRALVMVAVALGAWIRPRRVAAADALALAALAVALWDPLAVLSISSWLSFWAVALILWVTVGRHGPAGGTPMARLERAFSTQVVLGLGLAPLLLAVFGEQPLIAPLANLVAVPVVTLVALPCALAAAAVGLAWLPAAAGPAMLAEASLRALWAFLEALNGLNLQFALGGAPPPWTVGAAAVGVAVLCAPRRFPGRIAGLAWLTPLLLHAGPAPAPGALQVTVLDVGQGLAVVVRTAAHVLVYDTGPRYGPQLDAGSAVLVPYLRAHGVRFVDRVVISHDQGDHRGGLDSLRGQVRVERLIGNFANRPESTAAPCRAGTAWGWDGYEFRVLAPADGADTGGNDGSCVLRISGPGGVVLLPGDLEAEGERRLLEAVPARDLAADVVVMPHHGSRTSSTAAFVAALAPAVAVASSGYRNRHRHPDPQVLARYRRAGATVYDTARDGALTVFLDPGRRGDRVRAERHADRRYWDPRP